jgi:exoribonuclease-2
MVSEMMILINSLMARYCRQHDLPIIYRSQDPPEQPLIDEHVLSIAEGLARTTAMLRRMKRGDITTHPSPHFGLGLPMYVQSSSPIRRYSDLICQRQVRASLLNAPLPYDAETILKLAASVENTSREAMRTERETKRYWTLYHLQSCINEPLEATITYYPSEDSARAEVFLHAFAFRAYLNLKRKLPLGDTITVTVVKADPRQDLIHLKELA